MIAVIFEVETKDGKFQDYYDRAMALRPEVENIDGFISVERFESTATPGRYVSISYWRDEDAVAAWRANASHIESQEAGKAGIFNSYRIRVGEIVRDYGFPETGS
jgi:heme-degrading monooxygenase HmoA